MSNVTKLAAGLRQKRIREIHTGQGGAEVFAIPEEGRIVKYAVQEKCGESWPSHQREAAFCWYAKENALPFVPEIHYIGVDDAAQVIIQQAHTPLERTQLSETLLDAVMDVLADIHATPVPDFLQIPAEPAAFTDAEQASCLEGWESVLAEHPGIFSAETLRQIPQHINALNRRFFSHMQCLTHGDFHFDNLLMAPDGRLLVCDWQGCGAGDPSGDLSFFISRLLSDGYPLDADWLVVRYCAHAAEKAGEKLCVTPDHVRTQMALANLNTSFRFWHMFLHGAEEGRVWDIFGKMEGDFLHLMQTR